MDPISWLFTILQYAMGLVWWAFVAPAFLVRYGASYALRIGGWVWWRLGLSDVFTWNSQQWGFSRFKLPWDWAIFPLGFRSKEWFGAARYTIGALFRPVLLILSAALVVLLAPLLGFALFLIPWMGGLVNVFRGGRLQASEWAQKVDNRFDGVELRTFNALKVIRGYLDVGVQWLNFMVHPWGVVKELPIYWTLRIFSGAVWMALFEGASGEVTAQDVADQAYRYPTRPRGDVLVELLAGATARRADFTAAASRFFTGASS